MAMVVSLTAEKDYSWNYYKDGEEYIIMFNDKSIHTAIVKDSKFLLNDEDVTSKVIGHTSKDRLAFSLGFCGDLLQIINLGDNVEKVSLIKYFENKRERELEDYFELTGIDKMRKLTTKEQIEEYERICKEAKMPDHLEEELELYKNLTFDQWLIEIEIDYKSFLNTPFELLSNSVLTSDEKEKLAVMVFEKYDKLTYDTIKYISDEYINNSASLRKHIIEGRGINAIGVLKTLTYDEKIQALKNSAFQSINKVLETSNKSESDYFLKLYFCLEGSFRHIDNWQTVLTSELISLIIETSTERAEYTYGMLKDHINFEPYHTFLLVKKEPSIIGLIDYVVNEFGNIYIKTKDNKECELDLIMELSKSWHNLPVALHPLFMEFHFKPSIVKYEDFYKAYKELYT